ncbi:MAG: hypothetical protein ACM34J_08700, partial [Ignavibacteria bacterium]
LQNQRIELLALVSKKDSIQKVLEEKVADLKSEVEQKEAEVESLEKSRQIAQLNVRKLETANDLEIQLMETYPQVKESMRRIEVPVKGLAGVTLEYWSVPFRFSETFLIEHQNSENYKNQRDRLKDVTSMQEKIIVMTEKITVLEKEKSEAYKNGYDSAYVKYMDVNEKYLKLLNNPPTVEFGLPQIGAIAIGTAVGFAGGVALGSASK